MFWVFFSAQSPRQEVDFSLASSCCFLHFLCNRKTQHGEWMFHFTSALSYATEGNPPVLQWINRIPRDIYVYLPLSLPLLHVFLRLWYNIHHITSELKLDIHILLLFCFRRRVSFLHKQIWSWLHQTNSNKNSSLPLLPYPCWVFASVQTR